MQRAIFWLMALLLVAASLAAAGETPLLTQFDAGKTFVLQPGQTLRVQLEKTDTDAKRQWRWVRADETVLVHRGVETREQGGKTVEIHTFAAVAPGTVNVHAELVDPADAATPVARFPFTVQVVTPE